MTVFLEAICPATLWVFAILQAAFIALFALGFKKTKKLAWLFCALVSFGLFYDSLILALGVFVPAGEGLKAVSQLRYVSHGALIPLLFVLTAYALDLGKKWKIALIAVTAVLAVLGIAEGIATVLEPATAANVVRYAASKTLTPGWAKGISSLLSYGAVAPLIVGGIYDWVKKKSPYLCLSGVLMFVFSALGPATGNAHLIFFISMFGEFSMMLFLWLCLYKKEK